MPIRPPGVRSNVHLNPHPHVQSTCRYRVTYLAGHGDGAVDVLWLVCTWLLWVHAINLDVLWLVCIWLLRVQVPGWTRGWCSGRWAGRPATSSPTTRGASAQALIAAAARAATPPPPHLLQQESLLVHDGQLQLRNHLLPPPPQRRQGPVRHLSLYRIHVSLYRVYDIIYRYIDRYRIYLYIVYDNLAVPPLLPKHNSREPLIPLARCDNVPMDGSVLSTSLSSLQPTTTIVRSHTW